MARRNSHDLAFTTIAVEGGNKVAHVGAPERTTADCDSLNIHRLDYATGSGSLEMGLSRLGACRLA